jgi:diguanylate cyclase (GGDEF)-like protein
METKCPKQAAWALSRNSGWWLSRLGHLQDTLRAAFAARRRDGTSSSVRTLIRRLGIAVTVVTVILPPIGYCAVDYRGLRERAAEHASIGARQVELQLLKSRSRNWLEEVSTNVLHGMRRGNSAVVASWLTDKNGAALMFSGEVARWPEVWAKAPIKVDGFGGYFHVAVSTRNIWLQTVLVALLFLVIGLAAHFCFTRWPLAALDAASREIEAQKATLEMQNMRFDAAVNNMPIGLVMFDSGKRLIIGNEHYREMYGLPSEVMAPGTHLRRILENRLKAGNEEGSDREAYIQKILKLVERTDTDVRVVSLGDGRTVNIIHHPLSGGGWIGTHEDVTEREKLYAQLRSKQEQLDAAVSNMAQGLAMFDAELRVVVANQRYAQIYGLAPEQILPGTTLHQIINYRIANGDFAGKHAGEVVKSLQDRVAGPRAAHYVNELRNGRVIAVSIEPMADGGYVSTHQDVTDERRAEAKIAHMALHDALTDLPNRVLFQEQLETAVSGVRRADSKLALLMIDLDRFKQVNDTLGHPVGDALLKAVTERLLGCLRETDTIARLGGDEFAVVARVTDGPEEAAALAKRLVGAIGAPFKLDGHHVSIGASIGIAVAPQDGSDAGQLLKHADLALYCAKNEGRGTHRFFEAEMNTRMEARCDLECDLSSALVNGQFELHYQPLVELEHDEVCGFEALLRWNHPERGEIQPLDFIPLAEDTGLIVPIGEWVLRQACADAATWPDHIKVAINVSPAQITAGNLVDEVRSVLAATGVAPHRVELEITERMVLGDSDRVFDTLTRLHELGVRIALDDFGTGCSSLNSLRRFPFDKIKIDRTFINDLSRSNADAVAIVRSVAQLGANLGVATTAEGVETREELEQVRAEGCTEIQGFYICKPAPAHVISRIFLDQSKKAASAA